MMNKKPALRVGACVLLCAGCLWSTTLHAGTPPLSVSLADLSLEQLSDIVVTSVSRRDERLSDVPASIYVIRREDIRRSGATSLPEALRLAPNLQVARVNASDYAITARGGNSATANKLLVLIDGRTVYTPLFSGVFWDAQAVLLADIERIEVISGPGAAIWGANAVNGVINVITRSAPDSVGTHVEAGFGNQDRQVGLRYGAALHDDLHVRVYGTASRRDDTRRSGGGTGPDRARHAQAGWRADWDNGADRVTLQADFYRGEVAQSPAGREISGANLLARLTRRLGGDESLTVQAYVDQTERDVADTFRERLDTFDVEFQHGLAPSGQHRLIWGGGLRHARDRVHNGPNVAFLPARRTLNHGHLFVQDQWSISAQLAFSAGVKLETNPYTGLEVMPDLHLSYKPGEHGLVWASLARAVRAPARLDRDLFVPAAGPLVAVHGGPDFRSEIAYVAQLGYRGQPAPDLSYSVTLFHHDYNRLRSLVPTAEGAQIGNRITGSATGIEGWGSYQATRDLRLSAGLTMMNVERRRRAPGTDDRDLRALGNDPDLSAQLRVSYNLSARSELDLVARYVGALPDPAVPSYTTLDGRLAWRPTPRLELALLGQNLLNRRHAQWGPAANRAEFGRELMVRLVWRP